MSWANIKINSKVTLHKTEVNIVEALAKARYNLARSKNIENKKLGDQSNEFTDLNGLGGEFAFCKLFNIYPDFLIHIVSSDQNSDMGDCILPNGLKVDVKTTKYSTGRLLVAPWKKSTAVDLYVLMCGKIPTYIFKGFILAKELHENDYYLREFVGKQNIRYALQSELKELKDIV